MQEVSIKTELVQKVLRSVSSKRETAEEIRSRYMKLYPPSFFMKKLSPPIPVKNIEWALHFLAEEHYVSREITRFTDVELEEDTAVYSLTQKGMMFTLKLKKK